LFDLAGGLGMPLDVRFTGFLLRGLANRKRSIGGGIVVLNRVVGIAVALVLSHHSSRCARAQMPKNSSGHKTKTATMIHSAQPITWSAVYPRDDLVTAHLVAFDDVCLIRGLHLST
jgi:hypothetical protein